MSSDNELIVDETGAAIVPATGEKLQISGLEAIRISLPTLQSARLQRDIARLALEERISALSANDEVSVAARQRIADACAVIASVEEMVSEAITDDVRRSAGIGLKLPIGGGTITWAKPSRVARAKVSLGDMLTRAERGDAFWSDVVSKAGISWETGSPSAPVIRFKQA